VRAWLPDAKALSVADVVPYVRHRGTPEADWAEALAQLAGQDRSTN
jgi:hypothetical protein